MKDHTPPVTENQIQSAATRDADAQPAQLTFERLFQKREDFEFAVSLLDIGDGARRFLKLMFDAAADSDLRTKLSQPQTPCEIRRDAGTLWFFCDQSTIAEAIDYKDARTVRRALEDLLRIDPEEQLFRKLKVVKFSREHTVYVLNFVELQSRAQIDRDSIIYAAIETVGPNPFTSQHANRHPEIVDTEPMSGGLSGRLSGDMSARSSADMSAPDMNDDDELTLKESSSSSFIEPGEAALIQAAQGDKPREAHAAQPSAQAPHFAAVANGRKSFRDISDEEIRQIAGFTPQGTKRVDLTWRRQTLRAYFKDAIREGLAEDTAAAFNLFAETFCMSARYEVTGSRAGWLRKCWTNYKQNGRPPTITRADKDRCRDLYETPTAAVSR